MTEKEKKDQTIQWLVTGILMLIGLYNQLAITQGWVHIEVGDAQVTSCVTWVYELVIWAIGWYKNNNVTGKAQVSQLVLNALKSDKVTEKQVITFLENKELQDIADAHAQGQEIEVEINETAQVNDQAGD